MSIAVLTDSTSDMTPDMQQALEVTVVPLYINFKGSVLKDNLEIRTDDVFAGVKAGAGMPSTRPTRHWRNSPVQTCLNTKPMTDR